MLFIVTFIEDARLTDSFLNPLLDEWWFVVEILVSGDRETTTDYFICVAHWIMFNVLMPQVIYQSFLIVWFQTCFPGIISLSFFFIQICSFFLINYLRFCWKLRFLVLWIVLNCPVFFVKKTEVFVVFGILMPMERIQLFVGVNWDFIYSSLWHLFFRFFFRLLLTHIYWFHVL